MTLAHDLDGSTQSEPFVVPGFLSDGSRMSREINAFDWARTSLGPISTWPASLKMILRLVLRSEQPMCFWWGKDLLSFHNDAYVPMLGGKADRTLGRPGPVVWKEVWSDVQTLIDDALSGRSRRVENLPLKTTRNGIEELTHWSFTYTPLTDENDQVRGVLNIVTETTSSYGTSVALEKANVDLAHGLDVAQAHIEEQSRAERRQRLLQRELVHRMKNTLAMVQAIVSQTLRNSDDPKIAGDIIAERLSALSRAQDILTETSWTSAAAELVVGRAISPHADGSRIRFQGPNCELSAQQSLGLSLALHELATNAAKYGALSNGEGSVEIVWDSRPDRAFTFRWKEHGGPAVSPPTRRGFGSRLTERIVAGYFAGDARLAYEPDGVLFELTGELDESLN